MITLKLFITDSLRYSHIYNLYSRYDIAHLTLKIRLHEFITLVDGNCVTIIPCATYIHFI